jgi:hypothetical protein
MSGKGDCEYVIPFYGTRRPILFDFATKRERNSATMEAGEHTVTEVENVPHLPDETLL